MSENSTLEQIQKAEEEASQLLANTKDITTQEKHKSRYLTAKKDRMAIKIP